MVSSEAPDDFRGKLGASAVVPLEDLNEVEGDLAVDVVSAKAFPLNTVTILKSPGTKVGIALDPHASSVWPELESNDYVAH